MSRTDYTFSSLISLLLQTESRISQFYRSVFPGDEPNSFLQEYQDMANRLEKARTESVTEFTLEPIPSSDIDGIVYSLERVMHDDSLSVSQKLIQSEKLNVELLRHTSVLVSAISAETSQLLRSALRKTERRLEFLLARQPTTCRNSGLTDRKTE